LSAVTIIIIYFNMPHVGHVKTVVITMPHVVNLVATIIVIIIIITPHVVNFMVVIIA